MANHSNEPRGPRRAGPATQRGRRAGSLTVAAALGVALMGGCSTVSNADQTAHSTIKTILAEARQDAPAPFTLTDQDRSVLAGLWSRRADRLMQTDPDDGNLTTARNMFAAGFLAWAAYYRGDRDALDRAGQFYERAWDGMSMYETGEPRRPRIAPPDIGLMPGDDFEPNDEYPYGPGT